MTTVLIPSAAPSSAAPDRSLPPALHRTARIDPPDAGRIALALDRLATVGTVLYVAAHPDDENTRLLAWLANERGLRAVYLSLTRGDGGQNLVGSELGPELGLIRTYELLAARAVDGAEQRFTRAVDFGYSKSADETLETWGTDEVLADVVAVVREVRPDVIFTRFSTAPPNHGHHTASALLAQEAFFAAADRARFPDRGAPHQASRIFENKSSWRFKKDEDLSRYLALDVGGFSPLIGRSYGELAATSRSMHKSQGFGAAVVLGETLEYFEPTTPAKWPAKAPALPRDSKDPLAALDFTWARVRGGETVRARVDDARRAFQPAHPERLLPHLAKVRDALVNLPDENPYKAYKLAELDELMLASAGLVLDLRAAGPIAIPNELLSLTATAIARSPAAVKVAVRFPDGAETPRKALAHNKLDAREHAFAVTSAYSTPYWLAAPPTQGLFSPAPPLDGTAPVAPPALSARFTVELAGTTLDVDVPARHVWVDRVDGELSRPIEVLPAVTVTPTAAVRMFPGPAPRTVTVRVRAHGTQRRGSVALVAPGAWKVAPAARDFALDAEAEADLDFEVTPAGGDPVTLRLEARLGDLVIDRAESVIAHRHIPTTTVLSPATLRAVPLDIAIGPKRIGYITGAGDDVAASLEQVGYSVTALSPASLGREDLSRFDAIIAGIRAHNVSPELRHHHAALMRYVEGGGLYLVQYLTSTSWSPLDVPVGPYPFTIGRDRVTDETAEMRPLDPAHPALVTPNRLVPADYLGWVQERGLYFAADWDKRYAPLYVVHDPGESPLEGSVLVARHGKGTFVYTGLAFFRQLPDGVPGAYRLLANLLALTSRTK